MDKILITLAEVSKTAQEVRRLNTQMDQQLMQMRKDMDVLANTWVSPASDTIRTRFHQMAPIFQNYRDIVNSYATFLDHTVTSYENVETNINQQASSFQS